MINQRLLQAAPQRVFAQPRLRLDIRRCVRVQAEEEKGQVS